MAAVSQQTFATHPLRLLASPIMVPAGIGRLQGPVRRVLQPLVSRLWHFEVEGLENVPATGPAVLCPNHAAFVDSVVVPAVLDRTLIYVGKAEYLDDWKTKYLFPALGMIPIDRRGGDHSKAALDAARQVLRSGGLFGIYPEGTRSRSGKLHKGRTGAARLAVETGAPLIPVGLLGTRDIQPPDQVMPRFGLPVRIRFGRPIQSSRYRHRVGDHAVYRSLTDEVMFELGQLTGLEYVDTYANAPQPVEVAATAETADVGSLKTVPADAAALVSSVEANGAASQSVLQSRPAMSLAELLGEPVPVG